MRNLKSQISNLKSQPGFTLIETIIYLSIVSIILVSISYLIIDILGSQAKSIAGNEVNHNVRFISNHLAKDIRAAQAIGSLASDTLVLTMPGDDIIYNFDAGNLKLTRQVGAAAAEDLNTPQVEVTGSFTDRSFTTRSINVGVVLVVEFKNPDNLPNYNASSTSGFAFELRGRR